MGMKKDNFRVLFIYPNTMMATLVPIHISILSACLRKKGFTVDLFDTTYYITEEISFEQRKVELLQIKAFNFSKKGVGLKQGNIYEDLKTKVVSFNPDLIAVTIVEDTYDLVNSLLSSIEDVNIPVIAGGVFVTFSPLEVINNKNIDMICIGEGEEALLELCEKLSKGEDITHIRNLWTKKNGEVIKNPLRPAIDINRLPFINYDIFEQRRLYRPMYGKIFTMIHVEIDRGCPYSCTYCEAPQLRKLYKNSDCGTYYRKKDVDRLIAEMKHLVKVYNPDYINFNAESFLAKSVSELKQFARGYKGIGLPFWCQSRPETVTEEKIRILKDMRCQNLQFGIEHGNEQFRRKMLNRHHSNEQMLKAFSIVEKFKISYTVNNIIGFPDETRELIFDTININRQINPSTINCYIFAPYKGIALHKYCIEKGYIDKDTKIHQLLDGAKLKVNKVTYEQLKGLQRTFPLYAKMPKAEWAKIRIAEKFDKEGNGMYEELRKIYYARYFE